MTRHISDVQIATNTVGRTVPRALTSLPEVDEMAGDHAYDEAQVQEASDALRRHAAELRAQLRVMQGTETPAEGETAGGAERMDALHLVRAAAEFADVLVRHAQMTAAAELARSEAVVRGRRSELQERHAEVEGYRAESERQRVEILAAANHDARELLATANVAAEAEMREAEDHSARLLEEARDQATELRKGARAEVEHTFEWARTQASAVLARAQQAAEQLLASSGLDEDAVARVMASILQAAERDVEHARPRTLVERPDLSTS